MGTVAGDLAEDYDTKEVVGRRCGGGHEQSQRFCSFDFAQVTMTAVVTNAEDLVWMGVDWGVGAR